MLLPHTRLITKRIRSTCAHGGWTCTCDAGWWLSTATLITEWHHDTPQALPPESLRSSSRPSSPPKRRAAPTRKSRVTQEFASRLRAARLKPPNLAFQGQGSPRLTPEQDTIDQKNGKSGREKPRARNGFLSRSTLHRRLDAAHARPLSLPAGLPGRQHDGCADPTVSVPSPDVVPGQKIGRLSYEDAGALSDDGRT